VHGTLDITTKYLQYPFITTQQSWEKREDDLYSVVLDRNQKKFKMQNERNRQKDV
jgi:hypothetical protein